VKKEANNFLLLMTGRYSGKNLLYKISNNNNLKNKNPIVGYNKTIKIRSNQTERGNLMQEKKIPVVSIIFYVLAAILLAYSIWALSFSINYVSTAVAQNQLMIDGFEFEIASFYMSNVAQYVVFAAILFGIGWTVQKIEMLKSECFELEDDELFDDDWLEEVEEEVEEEIKEEIVAEEIEAEIREE